MQRMGSATESRDSGKGETLWVPMDEGLWRFEIGKPKIELSGFKNDDGSDKYRVTIPLQLTQAEYERAREERQPGEGETLSGRTWYRVGLGAKYPLGFYRDDSYVSTKLADFWCVCFGSKQVNRARKYLEHGGGPDYSAAEDYAGQIAALEEWLGWIEGCQVYGTVTHSADKKVPGKVWPNFGGPLAVGALPGNPEPDYQTFGLGKLRAIMTGSDSVNAEQGIAEGTAAKAEHTEQPELVTAAGAPAKQPRSYQEVFGDDGDDAE